jgi:hypothetical protein
MPKTAMLKASLLPLPVTFSTDFVSVMQGTAEVSEMESSLVVVLSVAESSPGLHQTGRCRHAKPVLAPGARPRAEKKVGWPLLYLQVARRRYA